MKRIFTSLSFFLLLALSLSACAPAGVAGLKGRTTEYSPTVAYANGAWGGVEITESAADHTLKNKTAQLSFGAEEEGLREMISLQTGETLLKNTVVTTLVAPDGTRGSVTGGAEAVYPGNYGVSHGRTGAAIRIPAKAEDASVLKEFNLTEAKGQTSFSALKNDVTANGGDGGLTVTSQGKNRSQFGARYLGVDLGTADHFYLSLTIKAQHISGLKCYFSTADVPLTEDTLLGTVSLAEAQKGFITLTAEIENELWKGTLQTLLFRLPEGETGSVEISRIAILTANDPLDEGVADTLWTVYSDRIYFSQTLRFNETLYTQATTVFALNAAKCKEISETENAVGIKMIDGSVLGFVRPLSGGALRVERDETEVRILLDLDLSPTKSTVSSQEPVATAALRIYLNYTEDFSELQAIALEERTPLTANDFILEGAEFERYDPKGGMYRITPTAERCSVTLKGCGRTVYLYADPMENSAWRLLDKKDHPLPIFAGATFPLCSGRNDLTVRLKSEPATKSVEIPSFFADSGLRERSRSATVLNGLCAQSTTVYDAPDASYSVTLTSTRLKDGTATIYDIRYDFLDRKTVADVLDRFPFFAFELTYGFEEYFYLNGENQTVTAPAGSEQVAYLGSMPYLCLSTDGETAGWLITSGRMTAGGTPSTAHLCLRYREVSEDDPNKMYLSFDQGETDFVPGDTLTAQVIRVETETVTEDALKILRNGGSFQLIQKAERNSEPFTVLGMEDSVILQIEGFDRYTFPKILANGEEFTPEYHVYVDKNGYYGFAFAVPAGTEIEIKK